jgi:protein associated with RNAse G/E
MRVLDEDEWGTWLWTPPGSTARRGHDPVKMFNHLNVKLIAPDQWWTAIWNDSGSYDLYVDIITPAAWNRDRVTMIDLDLDLVRLADKSVIIADEDEFAAHQLDYAYPQAVIDKAWNVAEELKSRISAGDEPFTAVGAARMQEAAALAANRS